MDINWQSFGWTDAPTSNPTGIFERRMAWGYKHSQVKDTNNTPGEAKAKDDVKYKVTLHAMPSREAYFFLDLNGIPTLETDIGGEWSRLRKIFVQTSSTHRFVPTVEYVELFGEKCSDGSDAYEKHIP